MIHIRNFKAVDSDCEMRVDCHAESDADSALALVTEEVERIDAKYSCKRKQSHWQQLVAKAGSGSGVAVDDETARLLDMAELGHTASEGLFDVTLSALFEIWSRHAACLPNARAIAEAMSRSGWSRVGWQRPLLTLPDVGMRMDFGGLIKEYAADACISRLREHGFSSALVALGDDVAACLKNNSYKPWQVDVRQSHGARNDPVRVEIKTGGIATRGDFDRCMVFNGIRYSHLLDPRTGWPVQGLASVSVVASECVIAGVLATTAMVRGPARGPTWLERLDVQYLCTDSAGQRSGPLHPFTEQESGVA